jgi:glycosyltransferase involved in cell wall biosynthesis
MAVAEAMHFGLPLILTDKVGSAADLLGDRSNGYIVDRDHPEGAAAALGRLVGDPELREQFGAASRDRVSQWNLDRAADGAVRAIRSAAARARARSPVGRA